MKKIVLCMVFMFLTFDQRVMLCMEESCTPYLLPSDAIRTILNVFNKNDKKLRTGYSQKECDSVKMACSLKLTCKHFNNMLQYKDIKNDLFISMTKEIMQSIVYKDSLLLKRELYCEDISARMLLSFAIDLGANINQFLPDYKGITPLIMSVESGDYQLIEMFLKKPTIDINKCFAFHCLLDADQVTSDFQKIITLFLQHKAIDVHCLRFNAYGLDGVSPLDIICLREDRGFLKKGFVKKSIQKYRIDPNKGFPLHRAIKNRHELVNLYCELPNIDVNKPNKNGETPLAFAYIHNNVHAIKVLSDHPCIKYDITTLKHILKSYMYYNTKEFLTV